MTAWRPRVIDVVALLGFALAWLVPMAWVAYLGEAPVDWPINTRDAYAVSCLFGRGNERVSMFYVQVRHAGQPGWHDLPEHEYFGLEPFGHRTRFDRFMSRFGYREGAGVARRELGLWLAAAHAERHPEQPPILALRFVWADRRISADDPPQGRWRKPPRAEAGPIHRLGEVVLIEEGAP
ncbi:hypothetical protein ENSA5_53270 [Enhygromyxa salina]|uniref:Uncharacterized protein n=1 Tax=Enhygromyxa salina TaxID=215803 RepID=A0A2S9XFV3_9BACT|nr:hypothetical protein [Enhygromyxa salina]PRP91746.1 hypothetical protein ENSA5_53270 [Enhygromyxa salina]